MNAVMSLNCPRCGSSERTIIDASLRQCNATILVGIRPILGPTGHQIGEQPVYGQCPQTYAYPEPIVALL